MENSYIFEPFDKIARLKRELVITEKLDGTNAQIMITYEVPVGDVEDYVLAQRPTAVGVEFMMAGSRRRWIAPEGFIQHMEEPVKGTDNFGFARWVQENSEELFQLGEGRHYGEWYGKGIQRGYNKEDKAFALFNTARWGDHNPSTPDCCEVVTLITGEEGEAITDPDEAMAMLDMYGSQHCRGFDDPEGIVVWHSASRTLYKQTFDNDGGKWRG